MKKLCQPISGDQRDKGRQGSCVQKPLRNLGMLINSQQLSKFMHTIRCFNLYLGVEGNR